MAVPVLSCASPTSLITFHPSPPPLNPLHAPELDIPSSALRSHLETAAAHVNASRLVAFPTETVYGLGAATLSPSAVKSVYELKGRPSDNPLIVHVSSLAMLLSLTPSTYELSELYLALVSAFWPGPLTLLFPAKHPPPLPAPQTTAIRIPSHPLARALIHIANTPISAPSANSSGRPSPTQASHVANDLGQKPHPNPLGCILDGGPCNVGVESTVVTGLDWSKDGAGGVLKVLRPGGIGVEELEKVCAEVDERMGTKTTVWVHGRDNVAAKDVAGGAVPTGKSQPAESAIKVAELKAGDHILNPSTPGMKYKHYSPSVPVYLVYPSSSFPSLETLPPALTQQSSAKPSPLSPVDILQQVLPQRLSGRSWRLGLMHYDGSPFPKALAKVKSGDSEATKFRELNMGATAEDAARALFGGMLALEGRRDATDGQDEEHSDGVDAILIEACSTDGLGLAVMERAGKAAGGGGSVGGLDKDGARQGEKRFWMQV